MCTDIDKCYTLQVFGIESSLNLSEIPFLSRSYPVLTKEDELERDRIKRAFSFDGEPMVGLGTFVCRDFDRARDMMLDRSFISTDWISCYKESDRDGVALEIYVSTDERYLCKISRTEIY